MITQSVADVMTPIVQTVTTGATASETARLLAASDIGSAIVVDPETDENLGIVTESDIMHQVATDADVATVRVGSFMSSPLVTVASTECIHTAAELMKDRSVQRLPVVDDGELVGILTTTDLVYYIPRLRREILRRRTALLTP